MEDDESERITIKVKGVEIALNDLADNVVSKMFPKEVKEALMKALGNTDKGPRGS